MRESQIEARLVHGVKARGGLCLKFTSPGSPGVPDRIVITPNGRVCFVELKTETGRLTKIQQWTIREMRDRGAEVFVVKGLAEVKQFLDEVLPHEV